MQHMKYWPGTKIVKSTNNAFNWKSQPSVLSKMNGFAKTNLTVPIAPKAFTIYSKAK